MAVDEDVVLGVREVPLALGVPGVDDLKELAEEVPIPSRPL
nr:hypothetical protein [Streptomyces sp. 846.5]